MRLTVEELKLLRPNQKLWFHDNRRGAKEPRAAVLKVWQDTYRFLLHIVDENNAFIDAVTWSVTTNGPLKEMRMPVNAKVWLTKRV